MKVSLAVVSMLAMSAAALGAQSTNSDPDKIAADGGVRVPGWTGRIDPRPASQGRKLTDTKFVAMEPGIHVTAGPAAIYWNPENNPSGNYTVKATFHQTKASTHPEGYGLMAGGKDLEKPNQSYIYFLVRQDGKYLINHRADDSTVHKVIDWTASPAVKAIDESGKATNTLSIEADATQVHFLVNGTKVQSLGRDVVGQSGLAGIRVNHNLDVHIEGFAVTPKK
jgi:hypothetical protein